MLNVARSCAVCWPVRNWLSASIAVTSEITVISRAPAWRSGRRPIDQEASGRTTRRARAAVRLASREASGRARRISTLQAGAASTGAATRIGLRLSWPSGPTVKFDTVCASCQQAAPASTTRARSAPARLAEPTVRCRPRSSATDSGDTAARSEAGSISSRLTAATPSETVQAMDGGASAASGGGQPCATPAASQLPSIGPITAAGTTSIRPSAAPSAVSWPSAPPLARISAVSDRRSPASRRAIRTSAAAVSTSSSSRPISSSERTTSTPADSRVSSWGSAEVDGRVARRGGVADVAQRAAAAGC